MYTSVMHINLMFSHKVVLDNANILLVDVYHKDYPLPKFQEILLIPYTLLSNSIGRRTTQPFIKQKNKQRQKYNTLVQVKDAF